MYSSHVKYRLLLTGTTIIIINFIYDNSTIHDLHAATRNVMNVESANSLPDLARHATYSHIRNRSFAVGQGLSEVDVATRQRYFENSG